MQKLSRETVEDIAGLGRLGLHPDEIEKMRSDLAQILNFFESLKSVSETAPDALLRTGMGRSDLVRQSDDRLRQAIVKNFPEEKNGFLKVRSVFSV